MFATRTIPTGLFLLSGPTNPEHSYLDFAHEINYEMRLLRLENPVSANQPTGVFSF